MKMASKLNDHKYEEQDLSRVVPSWVELSCIEIILDVVFEVDFKYILDKLEVVFQLSWRSLWIVLKYS